MALYSIEAYKKDRAKLAIANHAYNHSYNNYAHCSVWLAACCYIFNTSIIRSSTHDLLNLATKKYLLI